MYISMHYVRICVSQIRFHGFLITDGKPHNDATNPYTVTRIIQHLVGYNPQLSASSLAGVVATTITTQRAEGRFVGRNGPSFIH